MAETRPPSPTASIKPEWAVADDVFWERYGSRTLRQTEWHSLPHLRALSNQLPGAPPPPGSSTPAAAGNKTSDPFFATEGSRLEPWLLHPSSSDNGPINLRHASATRPHLLFQYKPYQQQEPLRLSDADVAAVLQAVFGHVPDDDCDLRRNLRDAQQQQQPRRRISAAHGNVPSLAAASDVASVILLKLVIDLYLGSGPAVAFTLVLHMLQAPLLRGTPAARAAAFDLIANLAIHSQLIYEASSNGADENDEAAIAEAVAGLDISGPSADWRHTVTAAFRASLAAEGSLSPTGGGGGGGAPPSGDSPHASGRRRSGAVNREQEPDDKARGEGRQKQPRQARRGGGDVNDARDDRSDPEEPDDEGGDWPPLPEPSPAEASGWDVRIERFLQWLRLLLYRMMRALATTQGPNEAAWSAAVSCLAALITHEGHVVRAYVEDMPMEALAALLEHAEDHHWPESLRCWLGALMANLLYTFASAHVGGSADAGDWGSASRFSNEQQSIYERRRGGGKAPSRTRLRSLSSGADDEAGFLATRHPLVHARLDGQRLKNAGGIESIARWYVRAPTLRCRRAFFCVLFDCVVGGCGIDSTEALMVPPARRAHRSEIDAFAAALLHARAAEAMHPLLRLGPVARGFLGDVADVLNAEMAMAQEEHPAVVVQAPAAFVFECLSCLQKVVDAGMGIPMELSPSVEATLTMSDRKPKSNRSSDVFAGDDVEVAGSWQALAAALQDESLMGRSIAECWLLRVLVAAANDMEAKARVRAHSQKGGKETARSDETVGGGLSLLPAPAGRVGPNTPAAALQRVLAEALPESRGAGVVAFANAVSGAIEYMKLLGASLGSNGSGGSGHVHHGALTPEHAARISLATIETAMAWVRVTPPAARQAALLKLTEAAIATMIVRYTDAQPTAEMTLSPSTGAGAFRRNGKSFEEPYDDSDRRHHHHHHHRSSSGATSASLMSSTPHRLPALHTGASSTPHSVPGRSRAGAMRGGTHLDVDLTQHQGSGGPSTPTAAPGGEVNDTGGVGGKASGKQTVTNTPVSPIGRVLPMPRLAAAWRRLTAPHGGGAAAAAASRGGGRGGTTAAVSGMADASTGAAGVGSEAQVRPLSAGASVLSSGEGQSQSQRGAGRDLLPSGSSLHASPVPSPRKHRTSVHRHPQQQRVDPARASAPHSLGESGLAAATGSAAAHVRRRTHSHSAPSLGVSLAELAAQRISMTQESTAAAAKARFESLAEKEARVGAVASYLSGLSAAPDALLRLASPSLLRALFEGLRPSSTGLMGAAVGGGANVASFSSTQGESLPQRPSALHVGRAFWDARAAILALLLTRCALETETSKSTSVHAASAAESGVIAGAFVVPSVLDVAFLSALLNDPDQRVRRHASVHALRRLTATSERRHRAAVRSVVAKAQRTGEERALCSPEAQVAAMLESRIIGIEAMV